jgi:hypothetical protein
MGGFLGAPGGHERHCMPTRFKAMNGLIVSDPRLSVVISSNTEHLPYRECCILSAMNSKSDGAEPEPDSAGV